MTSSAWVPIEPVDPRITTPRVMAQAYGRIRDAPATGPELSADFQVEREVVGDGQAEEHAVEPVERSPMAGKYRTEVLHAQVPFDHRFAQVTEERADGDERTQGEAALVRPRTDQAHEQCAHDERRDHPAHRSFSRLVRCDVRCSRRAHGPRDDALAP